MIFLLSHIRIKIDTAELLQQFIDGQIGTVKDHVYILPGAHPHIMSLPKLFAHHKVIYNIRFEDEDENVVNIDNYGILQAVFTESTEYYSGKAKI